MRIALRACLAGLGALAAIAVLPAALAVAGDEKPGQKKEIDPQPGKAVTLKLTLTDKDKTDTKRQGSYAKNYTVHLVKGAKYTITLRSSTDSYLRLEDDAGKEVAEDDDGGAQDPGAQGLDAKVEFTPEKTGKFKLIATTYDQGATGDFVLSILREGKGVVAEEKGDKGTKGGKELDPQPGKALTVKLTLTEKDGTDTKRQGSYAKNYSVNLVKGARYTITLRSATDSYLRLEDASGQQVAEDDDSGAQDPGAEGLDAKIQYTPEKSGKFKLIATTYDQGATGNFTLSILREGKGEAGGEKGDTGSGKEIDPQPGKAVTLKLTLTDKDKTDTKRQGSYAKNYSVHLVKGAKYTITMRSPVDSYLRLEDATGQEVAFDDDGGAQDPGAEGLDAKIEYTPEKTGKFKLIATTFAEGATGNFTLSILREGKGGADAGGGKGDQNSKGGKELDPQPGKAINIKLELTNKDKTDTKREGSYAKTYSVHLVKGARYTITMRSPVDSFLRLEDAAGQEVAADDDGGAQDPGAQGLDAKIEYTPEKTGKFKLIATTFAPNATGNFTLSILREGKGDATASGGGADLKVINGELTAKDDLDKVRQQSYCKVYPVKLQAGNTYQFDLKSTDLDSYLRLEGPDGNQIAEDDDSGGFLNAQIKQDITKSGEYKIIATTFAANATGKFTLEIRGKGVGEQGGTAPKQEKQAGAGELKLDNVLKAQIANNDKGYKNRNNHLHKAYSLKMEAGKTYTITMRSDDFDSYLYLEDDAGKVLAEDDDTGGGNTMLDAQITFDCTKSGTYRIVCTTYAEGATGNFTLEVRANKK